MGIIEAILRACLPPCERCCMLALELTDVERELASEANERAGAERNEMIYRDQLEHAQQSLRDAYEKINRLERQIEDERDVLGRKIQELSADLTRARQGAA